MRCLLFILAAIASVCLFLVTSWALIVSYCQIHHDYFRQKVYLESCWFYDREWRFIGMHFEDTVPGYLRNVFVMPIILPIVICGVPWLLWARERLALRRRKPVHSGCGYNLTGNSKHVRLDNGSWGPVMRHRLFMIAAIASVGLLLITAWALAVSYGYVHHGYFWHNHRGFYLESGYLEYTEWEFIGPGHSNALPWQHRDVFVMPIVLPFVICGAPWLFWAGWRLIRRRMDPGHCRCGYNFTGNTSGVCPECGTPRVQDQ